VLIRLVKDWPPHHRGAVLDMAPGAARVLMGRQIAAPEAPVRPPDGFEQLTVAVLRERCRGRGLPIYGNKGTLLARLRGADVSTA